MIDEPERAHPLDDLVGMMRAAAHYTARAGRRAAETVLDAAAAMDAAEARRLKLSRLETSEIIRRVEAGR